ncbi:hypothetical protein HanXRQr2_Chr17g0813451 [Helianthus annuus]|uniref:Uncharacterized protein n=1 Tax=Helianthus annuus TaxID=4232 RepID=A0A251RS91_HELAN|nr:hypothetical protein HanXRQr2_Chr17g0813451 [Helianthus annuus]
MSLILFGFRSGPDSCSVLSCFGFGFWVKDSHRDSVRVNCGQLSSFWSTAVNPVQSKSTGQDRSPSQRVRVNMSVHTVRSDDSCSVDSVKHGQLGESTRSTQSTFFRETTREMRVHILGITLRIHVKLACTGMSRLHFQKYGTVGIGEPMVI